MTNMQLLPEWSEFLWKAFGCRPDGNGNYPCDNGVPCDKCSDDSVWKMFQEKVSQEG